MEYDTMRIGIVMAVNKDDRTCRVKFPDLDDIISDWISVVQRPKAELIIKPDGKHSRYGMDDAPQHDHKESATGIWMPVVNDTVLCICQPIFNGDAFVLGVI